MPGYTGRASRVNGFDASAFFCCVAFLSIDGIAPKAVLSGVTQVDPFAHLVKPLVIATHQKGRLVR